MMNLNKSIVLKISMAGILTSLCILVFSCFTPKPKVMDDDMSILKSISLSLGENQDGESHAISWDEAQTMRNNFKILKPLMIKDSDGKPVALEGFKIKASQLLEIINNNKNRIGTDTADNVFIFFGASNIQSTLPDYNIIAIGEKNGSLMMPTSAADQANATKSSIYDKALPCPPMCPLH